MMMRVSGLGAGRFASTISAFTKPELYFQPTISISLLTGWDIIYKNTSKSSHSMPCAQTCGVSQMI